MRNGENLPDLRPEARTWGEVFSRQHLSGRGLVGIWLMILPITLMLVVTLITERGSLGLAVGTIVLIAFMGAILFKSTKKYMASRAHKAAERRFDDPNE